MWGPLRGSTETVRGGASLKWGVKRESLGIEWGQPRHYWSFEIQCGSCAGMFLDSVEESGSSIEDLLLLLFSPRSNLQH